MRVLLGFFLVAFARSFFAWSSCTNLFKPGFPDVTRSVASYVAAVTARMFSSLSLASAPP